MSIHKLLDHHNRQVKRRAWSDLRQFCYALETSGQLKSVLEPVSPYLQVTELCHRSLVGSGPALLFENIQGHDMSVLGNLFGNQERVLAALELESRQELLELGHEFAFLRNPRLPDSLQSAMDAAPGFARLGIAWMGEAGARRNLSTSPTLITCKCPR